MNLILRIALSIFLCLSLSACSHTSEQLNSAEQLMSTTPDSALHILQKLKPNLFTTRSHKALYALLMSQALNKNDIMVESDSLISIATRYYKEDDPVHAGYAWFYLARCANNRGDAKTQADALLKAQEYAEKADNETLKGLIYGDKGLIYGDQSQFDSSIIYTKKAYHSFIAVKNYRNSILSLVTIGYKYLYTSHKKKAIYYLDAANKLTVYCKDADLLSSINRHLGIAYYQLNNYKKAIIYFHKTQLLNNSIHDDNKWYLLASAYVKTNVPDSARFYLSKMNRLNEMAPSYYGLWLTLYERQGDINNALLFSKKVISATDSLYKRKLDVSFVGMEKRYKYQNLQISNQQLAIKNKQNSILLLIILFILSMGIIAFLLWRNRQKNHQLLVKQQLLEKEKNLLEKEIENNNLLEKQLKIQNVILSNVEQYRINAVKRPLSSGGKQAGISPVLNRTFHEELIASMDIQYHDISKRLIERFPDLTERDILICCLLLAEFESGMIASILDVKIESINKHRYRLRTKLELQNPDNLVEYLRNF